MSRVPFSRRTAWELGRNPFSKKWEALRATGAALVDLTETNPTACGLGWSQAELADALSVSGLDRYEPEPLGLESARAAVARHWHRRGAAVRNDAVMLTASTSEAYGYLFKLLCDPGDAVVCFTPGYPLLGYLTDLEPLRVVSLQLHAATDWALPVEELAWLLAAPEERIRAVVLVHPANPTGQFLKRGEIDTLTQLCAASGVALICDEVFADYTRSEDPDRVATLAGRESPALTFVMSGLSKVAALPQLKLAWTWMGGPATAVEEARARLEVIADTFLSVSTPVQRALPALLEGVEPVQARIRSRMAENLRTLKGARTPDSPWSVLAAEGGWSSVLRIPERPGDEATALRLLEAGVIVQPGHLFDLPPAHLVVSLLPPPDVFSAGVSHLVAVLDR